jgi:hypothetical protein
VPKTLFLLCNYSIEEKNTAEWETVVKQSYLFIEGLGEKIF